MSILKKKMTLRAFAYLKLRTLKTWIDQCLKSPVSEDASTSNMVNVPKHCWNLHHSIFIILIGHWQGICFGKRLSYWHAKSWDCLLTRWLLMKSILFLIVTNSRYQFICNYIRNKKLFLDFLLHFSNLDSNLKIPKKKMTLIYFVFPKLQTPKT